MPDDPKTVQFNTPPDEVLRERRSRRELTEEQRNYQAKMAAAKAKSRPHGGAPPVSIPPLNAEPIDGGGTMQQQAATLRDPTSPLSPAYSPELAAQQAQFRQQAGPQGPFSPLSPGAQQDPRFIQGMGSMIAGNQPHLQQPPKERRAAQADGDGYKPHLSEETRKSMEALAAMQAAVDGQTEAAKKATESESMPKDAPFDEEGARIQREIREMLGSDEMWTQLNNPERRKEIEGRVKPMDLTDIIIHGEVRQTVPVQPGKLEISYRSVSGDEDLAVKRMMAEETSGNDRYLLDKYTLFQLTLALVSINDEPLPDHLDVKREFDERLFLEKYKKVAKFPMQFLADLGIQYLWFDQRVRNLFVGETEALKNS